MEAAMYDEFVGITQHVDYLIERNRIRPGETKCEILARVLGNSNSADPEDKPVGLDLGEGVRLSVGEMLYLFLHKRKQIKEDATAEIKEDGLYMGGQKIVPSKGSLLQPAMQIVQRRLNHYNNEGQLVSLSAWRQWHVLRDGKLVRLFDLKDPAKAKKRGGQFTPIDPTHLGF
jgi:hypothetical protein